MGRILCIWLAALCAACSATAISAQQRAPLSAEVQFKDADRFAEIFNRADGRPSAEDLQQGYLDGAGRGVQIFTPDRIEDAANLAREIAEYPAKYRRAIDVCLPAAKAATADLRAIYLGLSSVFPRRELPELYVVFGAGNSGGTAGSDAQVIGLEVICEIADTPEQIRQTFRRFFAHETVHVLQAQVSDEALPMQRDPLLTASLREGFADFVAALVTGEPPEPARNLWAKEREDAIWTAFQHDRARLIAFAKQGATLDSPPPEAMAVFRRWHFNYGGAPAGWPSELGYWVGEQISRSYLEQADDKQQAINNLLILSDPEAILEQSGYADKPKAGAGMVIE